MAAATTSLPETPGGGRNWDYRYTWIRDGVCTMAALQDLGFRDEAHAFLGFIADRLDEAPLQVMYGIGGERELPESTLDHLSGYEGAQPVRIGNGAVHQRQHDMWGWLLLLIERDLLGSRRTGRRPDLGHRAAHGHRGDRTLATPRPGHLGDPRRGPSLRLVQAHGMGRPRSGRTARRATR